VTGQVSTWDELRLAVYLGFARDGRAPTLPTLAEDLGLAESEVREGLAQLATERHVVLDADGSIVMAHPFSAVPLGFSVMGRETLWWGGCCWDSFAFAHLLPDEEDVLVATRCPGCDRAGAWVVSADEPSQDDWVAHFLVPVQHMWDDVLHTCGHQRLFCSEACLDAWCTSTGNERGYVMDLESLWRLASQWYAGRLDPGYARREPAAATEYLRSVGLVDPFWGTA
jgi:hypothetical protein